MDWLRAFALMVWVPAVVLAQRDDAGCQGNLKVLAEALHSSPPAATRLFREPYAGVGTYEGRPVVAEWLPDGRLMRTKQDLRYTDPCGTLWDAPPGSITDGASIPKWAWSIIGGPFEGRFRDAAVIHDVACEEKKRPWKAVHEAFYFAMLAAGGLYDRWQSKVMFAAVYHFGPRWSDPQLGTSAAVSEMTREQFDELAARIRKGEERTSGVKGWYGMGKMSSPRGRVVSLTEIEEWKAP